MINTKDRWIEPCPPGKCRRAIDGQMIDDTTEVDFKISTCRSCGWSLWSINIRLQLLYGPAMQFFETFVKTRVPGRLYRPDADPAGEGWSSAKIIESVKLDRIPETCIHDPMHHRLPRMPPGAQDGDLDSAEDLEDLTLIDPPYSHLPRTDTSSFRAGHTIIGAPLVHLPYRSPVSLAEQLDHIETDPDLD